MRGHYCIRIYFWININMRWLLFILCLFLVLPSNGQIVTPLYVGNTVSAISQLDVPFSGTCGFPQNSSLVEIRVASDGIIRPPSTSGLPHYKNPLITNSYMGMNAMGRNPGLFCVVFPYRIPTGTNVFARVFNDINAEQATFYADTSVVVAPPKHESSLVLNFGVVKPLNPGDDDNDGLNNSWEEYLGINDRPTSDYDHDGFSDLNEMLAGTAPDDPNSIFKIKYIVRMLDQVDIGWYSVPGKRYQIQGISDLIEPFTNIGESTIASNYEENIVLEETNRMKHYRVIIPR